MNNKKYQKILEFQKEANKLHIFLLGLGFVSKKDNISYPADNYYSGYKELIDNDMCSVERYEHTIFNKTLRILRHASKLELIVIMDFGESSNVLTYQKFMDYISAQILIDKYTMLNKLNKLTV